MALKAGESVPLSVLPRVRWKEDDNDGNKRDSKVSAVGKRFTDADLTKSVLRESRKEYIGT